MEIFKVYVPKYLFQINILSANTFSKNVKIFGSDFCFLLKYFFQKYLNVG